MTGIGWKASLASDQLSSFFRIDIIQRIWTGMLPDGAILINHTRHNLSTDAFPISEKERHRQESNRHRHSSKIETHVASLMDFSQCIYFVVGITCGDRRNLSKQY